MTKLETFTGHAGQVRYRCPFKWESGHPCEFDSYSEALVAEHWKGTHAGSVDVDRLRGRRSLLFGPNNKPLRDEQ